MAGLTIWNAVPPGPGWGPIHHLAGIMARILDAELVEGVPERDRARELALRLPWRKPGRGGRTLLIIVAKPNRLLPAICHADWGRYGRAAALVIDSFDTHFLLDLPYTRFFSHLFVMTGHDLDLWRKTTGVPVTVLPWGTDTLAVPARADRPVDVLRIGRQPAIFEDDGQMAERLAARGLAFQGKPGAPTYRDLLSVYRKARLVLASSNLIDPADYVHRSKEYVTARWTDAIAAGARVAGAPPEGDPFFSQLIEEEDLVRLTGADLEADLAVLSRAVAEWDEDRARARMSAARQRLDWRHRIATLADILDIDAPALRAELASLRDRG